MKNKRYHDTYSWSQHLIEKQTSVSEKIALDATKNYDQFVIMTGAVINFIRKSGRLASNSIQDKIIGIFAKKMGCGDGAKLEIKECGRCPEPCRRRERTIE